MNQMLPRPRFWAETADQMKTHFSALGELLIFFLLFVISLLAQSVILTIPMTAWMMGTQSNSVMEAVMGGASMERVAREIMARMPDWMSLMQLFASAIMGVTAVVYSRAFQKRSFAAMGLRGRAPVLEYLAGFAVGLVLFAAVVALGAAAGGFRLLAGAPSERQRTLCLIALLGCAVHGAALELLIRGCFAPSLGARYPVVFALLLSSITPSMLQAGETLFSMTTLNSLLLGLFLGIWVIKRGRLWGACAIHAAWTFAGSFLFGLTGEGEYGDIRLLNVASDVYRPLLTGGDRGAQASICVTVVLLAAIAGVLALRAKEPAPPRKPEQTDRPANFL